MAIPLLLFILSMFTSCIFDTRLPSSQEPTSQTQILDSIYSTSAKAARSVQLYQPLFDPSLSPGTKSAVETFAPVNVKPNGSDEIVQYQLSRQKFGTWSAEQEFAWNYFLLQSNFIFIKGLPDTTGMKSNTKTLYDSIHLTDKFTNYFDSSAAPSILNRITSSTKPGAMGISVKVVPTLDTVEIARVAPNSPAMEKGLKKGMKILSIDDSTIVGDSAVVRFQRFSPGDSGKGIKLKILGPEGIVDVTLIRRPVAFPTVYIDTLSASVGYISVSGFTPVTTENNSTQSEFHEALIATRNFPITLIDLRDNPGGSLDLSLEMADDILPLGKIIIRQEQRRFDENWHVTLTSEVTALATSAGVGEIMPNGSKRKYLLLANEHSASAAEILLIALKEGTEAKFMGKKTYGKGVGQTVRNTPGKGLALVTFLKFTSASGLFYHQIGIDPDYPDSSADDSLLIHATQKAEELISVTKAKPLAKQNGLGDLGISDALRKKAALVEWNRKQSMREKDWAPSPIE